MHSQYFLNNVSINPLNISYIKARTERRHWTELNWHDLVFDKLTNTQSVMHYNRRHLTASVIMWLHARKCQPITNGLALLAHWSVRQKLKRVTLKNEFYTNTKIDRFLDISANATWARYALQPRVQTICMYVFSKAQFANHVDGSRLTRTGSVRVELETV